MCRWRHLTSMLHAGTVAKPERTDPAPNVPTSGASPMAQAQSSAPPQEVRLNGRAARDAGPAQAKPPPCPFVFGSKPAIPATEPPPVDAIPAHKWFQNASAAALSDSDFPRQAEPCNASGASTQVPAASADAGDKAGLNDHMGVPERSQAQANGFAPPSAGVGVHGAADAKVPAQAPFVFGSSRNAEPQVQAPSGKAGPTRPDHTVGATTVEEGHSAAAPAVAPAAAASMSQPEPSAQSAASASWYMHFGNAARAGASAQPLFPAKMPTSAGLGQPNEVPPVEALPGFKAGISAGLKSPRQTPSRGRQRSTGRTSSVRKSKRTPAKAQPAAGQGSEGVWHQPAFWTFSHVLLQPIANRTQGCNFRGVRCVLCSAVIPGAWLIESDVQCLHCCQCRILHSQLDAELTDADAVGGR